MSTIERRQELQLAIQIAQDNLRAFDRALADANGFVRGIIVETNDSGAHNGRHIRIRNTTVSTWPGSNEMHITASGHVLRKSDGAESRTYGSRTLKIDGSK